QPTPAGLKQQLKLWDVETEQLVPLADGEGQAVSVAWNPTDGKQVAWISAPGVIKFYDVRTKEELRPPLQVPSEIIWAISWSPDGKRLAASCNSQANAFGGSEGTLRVWQVDEGMEPLACRGHSGSV